MRSKGLRVRRGSLAPLIAAGGILALSAGAGAQTVPAPVSVSAPPLAAQRPDSGSLLALRDGMRVLDSTSTTGRDQLAKSIVGAMLALRYPDSARVFARTRRLTLEDGQFRELSCQLIDARRWDDAISATGELLDPPNAAWSLGHIALQLAHPPYRRSADGSAADDTTALRQRAVSIARSIALPEARVDALLAVAGAIESPRSKPNPELALALYRDAAVSAASIVDSSRRSARGAMIAVNLARHADSEGARRLLPLVTARRDWWILAWSLASMVPRDSIGASLRARAIAEARKQLPPGAQYRRRAVESLVKALRAGGDSAQAAQVERTMLRDAWTFRPEHVSRSQYEIAMDAAEAGDTASAARAASRIPDSEGAERKVEVWIEMVRKDQTASFVTRQAWLIQARGAALGAQLDSASRDFMLAGIASAQFYYGANEDALATLAAVRADPDLRWPFSNLGHSTLSRLDGPASVRALASHTSRPVLRDQVLAYLVSDWLAGQRASAAELAWGEALVDSIADPTSRQQATLAIADATLQRGDSARARRLVIGLLAETSSDSAAKAAGLLARSGGKRELLEWAHSRPTPEKRIAALIVAARALEQPGRGPYSWSNGPDPCRHPF